MRSTRAMRFRTWMLAVFVATLTTPALAAAGGVVGDGTPGSCTEAALDAALAGGGSITFNCGASPVTITVTSAKNVTKSTSLDGGGLITLSGGGTTQLFVVNTKHVTLSLENVTISDGLAAGSPTRGGAIYSKGTLNVANSTFANNTAPSSDGGSDGGAIFNLGALSVTDSTFNNNTAVSNTNNTFAGGGAIFSAGVLRVSSSTFSNNSASAGNGAIGFGGAIQNLGTASVASGTFLSNSSGSAFGGGAICNMDKLSVSNSTFANNTSPNGSGGAIYNFGPTLSATNSTFTNNSAALAGGAIESEADSAPPSAAGKVTVVGCTFAGNSASEAGAIDNIIGRLTVTNSTFADNSASVEGGAIYNFDQLTAASSTFFDNTSANGAGAAIDNAGTASAKNTIIATTTSDENCLGGLTDKGHNIDSGASCGFSHTHGSLSSTDPQLDPAGLADNGGPTQTVAVEAGSPAINAGNESACKAAPVKGVDQRGFARPGTGSSSCTIGAYEFNSPGPRSGAR